MADLLNNNMPDKATFGLFHKNLHLKEDNVYLYEKNLNKSFGLGDDKLTMEEKIYHIKTSKARIDISKLFENDAEVQKSAEL
jgi:hypothetical protein